MRSAILVRAGTVLLSCIAVAVACSAVPTLDADSAEEQILEQLQEADGPAISAVDCPDGIEVAAEATFTCTATGEEGDEWPIAVTQVDDSGTLDYRILAPI